MMLPFSISFSNQFKENISPDKYQEILNYIKDFISKKKAEDIFIGNNRLTFNSKLFKSNSLDVLMPIEKGVFQIENKNGLTILTYEFFMYRLLIIAAGFSILAGLILNNIDIGIKGFLILGVLNWIVAIVRHRIMLNNISTGIKTLFAKS